MFQENEKEWILEAINHLKHRKARPDLSRISLRMKRKHQMSFAQTKKLLDSLIECGIVVKAVYKNNTSYRDVSKWKKGRLGGQIMNSNKMLKRFIRAIEATEKEKGTGVSAKDIEDFLASQGEEKCFLSGAALKDALENEISNGYLRKFSFGTLVHYAVNTDNISNVSQMLAAEEQTLSDRENHNDDSESNIGYPDVEHLLTNVLKAISETEHSEGTGSSFLDIKEYLLIKGIHFTDDSFLLDFLEKSVRNGILTEVIQDSVILYSVHEDAQNLKDQSADSAENTRAFEAVTVKEECDPEVDTSTPSSHPENFPNESFVDYRGHSSAVPLRPPSKRKVSLQAG